MANITTNQVWTEIEKQNFAVVGMVTPRGEARSAGVVFVARNRKLYFASLRSAWKVRHIEQNAKVSVTIPITRRIPFLPWIKIPAATITFSGEARLLQPAEAPTGLSRALLRETRDNSGPTAQYAVVEIAPQKDFVTYGVGVSLAEMRDPAKARGRTSVNGRR